MFCGRARPSCAAPSPPNEPAVFFRAIMNDSGVDAQAAGAETDALSVGAIVARRYCSQFTFVSPASITQVSVFAPPSTESFPETLSRDFRKSFPPSSLFAVWLPHPTHQ